MTTIFAAVDPTLPTEPTTPATWFDDGAPCLPTIEQLTGIVDPETLAAFERAREKTEPCEECCG